MDQPTKTISADEIPLIDLSDFDNAEGRARISKQIREACISVGFFLIKGHGVPRALSEGAEAASKRYFSLPDADRKLDLIDERFRRGLMPTHEGPRAFIESYEFSLDLPLDDPDVAAGHFLHGPNRYPDRHPWFRGALEPYLNAMLELAERLERLFALSLNLDEEFFVKLCKKPTFHMRLMHYLPQTEEQKLKQNAVPPHTDFGMLTILMQDPRGGLEVQLRNGEWVRAPNIEDTFVINVGDMLELWTNELYVSTPHRVIGLTGLDRYSVPAFFSPAFDTLVECIPSCLAPGDKPKFKPLEAGKYLAARLGGEDKGYSGDYDRVGGHRRAAN